MENRNYIGIVRQMDDLGRIVIPKEIRKGMGIREGDNIEIFATDLQEIVLRKATVKEVDGVMVKTEDNAPAPDSEEPLEFYFENRYDSDHHIIFRVTPEQNKLLDFLRENELLDPDFSLRKGLPEWDITDLTK